MKTIVTPSSFGFTSMVWYEVGTKTWLFHQVEDKIKETLFFGNYANEEQVKELIFTLQISFNHQFHQNSFFAWKRKIIFLFGTIDYQTFLESSDQQALKLMCEAYLNEVLKIPTLKGMKKTNFEVSKLHNDLLKLFQENNWV